MVHHDVLEEGLGSEPLMPWLLLTMPAANVFVSAFLLVISWQQIVALSGAFQAHHDPYFQ